MTNPAWLDPQLDDGVLLEPTVDENRLVLWMLGERDQHFQHWERIASVARAGVIARQGICTTAATSVRARQHLRGFCGRLWQRLRERTADDAWTLPNGEAVEQCGARQTDLLLVWGADAADRPDESQIRTRWPEAKRVQQLGPNLFVVDGVPPPAAEPPPPEQPPGTSREQAERLVATARQASDRRREITALTDLGIACWRDGDAPRAVVVLEEAVILARQLGNRAAEHDAEGHLGLALLNVGQIGRAQALFEKELAYARTGHEVFAEKAALFHLGLAAAHRGDIRRALVFCGQALTLARQVGDRQDEADLLWHQAILHADLGQREQALVQGQAAVSVLQKLGKPQAAWFDEHLQKYRRGAAGSALGATELTDSSSAALSGGIFVANTWAVAPTSPLTAVRPAADPGWLRMAFTATKAMAKFIGSGCKRVPAETHAKRLRTCKACEHHTGLRCRLCGCFTNTKAWVRYEDCPVGKWPH